MNRDLFLSPAQMAFVTAKEKYTLFCGGLGSGKTYGGAAWAMLMTIQQPQTKGLITANSYSQLRKATLPKFFELLDKYDIKFKYKSQEGIILIGDTVIYTISMENYDLLRGIEVGWAWSDECAFYREEAFQVLIGRIRDRRGSCQWKGTTTPNGFNFLYTKFVEKPLPQSRIVTSRTADNLANLAEAYVSALQSSYDLRLAQQELDGQFVNLSSGKVYYSFDRTKNCKKVPNGRVSELYCGLDFNVHPLCGVFGYIENGKILVMDELYQEDSNTFKAAREICTRFPSHAVRVVADDSGKKRKTSSDTTDYEILRRANLEVEKFKNPEVKDRYNNLNRLFDHDLIVIDPRCKKLIEDLEKMTYDNKDPMLSHISDALGYLAWKINPMQKPKRDATVTYL